MHTPKILVGTLLVSSMLALSASAQILYLENFDNTANGTNFNTGWNWGNADANLSSVVLDGTGVRHEPWSQSPNTPAAIGSNPVPAANNMGVPFTPFNGATSRFMYTLEVASLNLTFDDVKAFQADFRKNMNTNQVWFGLMTGNTWYFINNAIEPVVDTGVLSTYTAPAVNFQEINQVYNGTDGWGIARTVTPGNILGPATLTGTETIEGFGVLFTTQIAQLGNIYMDNFALLAIPEPSTYALLLGAGSLGLLIIRKRRKQ